MVELTLTTNTPSVVQVPHEVFYEAIEMLSFPFIRSSGAGGGE